MMGDDCPRPETTLSSEELLTYYKTRIGGFEKEREELLRRIETLSVDQKELHRLEWENKQRTSEIWELQKALSGANDALFRERGRLLKLQAENDDHKLREEDDRKKIQYLLSFTQAGEQEITYLRNSKPDTLDLRPNTTAEDPRRGVCGERTLRTVYLPTANADGLILKVEALQAQLNEQRQYCVERVEALLRDKRITEEQMSNHRLNYEQRIEVSGHKIQKLEEMLRNCTRDYILARRGKQENEERAITAETALHTTKEELTHKLTTLKERTTTQLLKLQRTTQEAIDDSVEKFQSQVQGKQNDILAMEKTFRAAQVQYAARISDLECRIAKLTQLNRRLETRRGRDLEGFRNETSLLRKKVSVVERRLHQMRLIERLGEDDRLDRMLQEIENKMPNLRTDEGEDYVTLCTTPTHLANEVQKIQMALEGIEERIRERRDAAQ